MRLGCSAGRGLRVASFGAHVSILLLWMTLLLPCPRRCCRPRSPAPSLPEPRPRRRQRSRVYFLLGWGSAAGWIQSSAPGACYARLHCWRSACWPFQAGPPSPAASAGLWQLCCYSSAAIPDLEYSGSPRRLQATAAFDPVLPGCAPHLRMPYSSCLWRFGSSLLRIRRKDLLLICGQVHWLVGWVRRPRGVAWRQGQSRPGHACKPTASLRACSQSPATTYREIAPLRAL